MKKWILKGLIIQYDMRKKFVCVPSMNNNFDVGKMMLKYRDMVMMSVQFKDRSFLILNASIYFHEEDT